MADVTIVNDNANFTYDPQISQVDNTFWRYITGTPTFTSNNFRMNTVRVGSYSQYRYADIEFTLIIPTAPTAGHVRAWGFSSPNLGNRGRIEFDVTDAVFSVRAYANDGSTVLLNETITWDAAWTNTATRFRIQWGKNGIRFYLNDTQVRATQIEGSVNPVVPNIPLAIHMRNGVADNMDMVAIVAKDIQALT